MNSELFEVGESLSPKMRWLRDRGLITQYDETLKDCPESPETGGTCYPWIVTQADVLDIDKFVLGAGRTEDDAIIDFCQKSGTPHYLLEQ